MGPTKFRPGLIFLEWKQAKLGWAHMRMAGPKMWVPCRPLHCILLPCGDFEHQVLGYVVIIADGRRSFSVDKRNLVIN